MGVGSTRDRGELLKQPILAMTTLGRGPWIGPL